MRHRKTGPDRNERAHGGPGNLETGGLLLVQRRERQNRIVSPPITAAEDEPRRLQNFALPPSASRGKGHLRSSDARWKGRRGAGKRVSKQGNFAGPRSIKPGWQRGGLREGAGRAVRY